MAASPSLEERLYKLLDTRDKGKDLEVKDLLELAQKCPAFDINWRNDKDYLKRSLLHVTCFHNRHEVLSQLLLGYPGINVNQKDGDWFHAVHLHLQQRGI
jgi:hypothetical protein